MESCEASATFFSYFLQKEALNGIQGNTPPEWSFSTEKGPFWKEMNPLNQASIFQGIFVRIQGDKSILDSNFFLKGSDFWSNNEQHWGLDESTQRLRVCLTHDGRIRPVARIKRGDNSKKN